MKAGPYAMLAAAIVCEVGGTTCLRLSEGFSVLAPSIAVAVLYTISFTLFTMVLKEMSLGLAYGIWGGVGTLLTTLVGVFLFHDAFTAVMGVGLVLVIAGIALLNQGTEEAEATRVNAKMGSQ